MLKSGNVVVVEWLEKVKSLIGVFGEKAKLVWVTFEGIDQETRLIRYRIDL
jgi:hypothetical protein